ncbi:hypothetical protein Glove_689g8 [Diversispora epigaea]|uniref:DUF6570 domain-containing protein n=1 Tax=Diversispora epigaea TaxID=1348612 RepID=A0A397G6Y2_9GLOM|nr:hypothetical protein Glove_689g8 [Diversispora epigaea]
MNLIQLTNKKHTYHKLRGHIITLPQNLVSLVNVLPLPIYRLCEYLKVVFVERGKPSINLLKKILQVRKSKITAVLKWLFEHNVLFKNNFNFDKNSLDLLLEGEIPESLIWTTPILNIDSQNIEHFTGYTQDLTDDIEDDNNDSNKNDEFSEFTNSNTIGGACELRPSRIVHTNDIPISEKELTLFSFQRLMNNMTIHQPSMCHRDPKFRQHRSFPFVAFNILQRREVSSEKYNLTRNYNFERSVNLIATLKSEDISIAINQEQNKQLITNPAILKLFKNVSSSRPKLIASPQSHTACATKYVLPIVMMYAGKEINVKNLPPENFPKTTERARLAHLDPSAVAKYLM